jgi:ATP-binding cassette subfamily F protein uup
VNLGVRAYGTLDLRSYLELFLFDGNKQRQKVGALSGGERARVALAKVLREGANVLVFDEPTNDLDLPTLTALEELLDGYEGSLLVVTHDRAFLDRIATAILAFEQPAADSAIDAGRVARVTRYAGGYQDYVAQRGERAAAQPKSAPPVAPDAAPAKPRTRTAKSALTYAERIELDGIVDEVDRADKAVAEIEALLADPSLYAKRGHEVAPLQARLAAARAAAAKLAARWEELEAKKGASDVTC